MRTNIKTWRTGSVTRDAMSALQDEFDALRRENEELQEQLQECRDEIAQEVGEEIRDKYEEQLEALYREKEEWKERCETAQKELSDMTAMYEQAQHDMQVRMATLRQVLGCTVNNFEGDITNNGGTITGNVRKEK